LGVVVSRGHAAGIKASAGILQGSALYKKLKEGTLYLLAGTWMQCVFTMLPLSPASDIIKRAKFWPFSEIMIIWRR